MLRSLLSRDALHSVRDSYTEQMLASIGIRNVVNTGCPTIWPLTPERCTGVPHRKADAVVTTVNSYAGLQDRAADRRLLEILKRHYTTVYLWIQTHTDHEYARSLVNDLVYINPWVAALDRVLTSDVDLDYVGIRLHAGIRALQRGRRTIIIEIDNRAHEMAADFGLPTVGRTDYERLEQMITRPFETVLKLPDAAIARWKSQFRGRDLTARAAVMRHDERILVRSRIRSDQDGSCCRPCTNTSPSRSNASTGRSRNASQCEVPSAREKAMPWPGQKTFSSS